MSVHQLKKKGGTLGQYAPVIALSCVCGYLLYVALSNHYAYAQVKLRMQREVAANLFISASLWRYAIVESVDEASATLVVRLENQFKGSARSFDPLWRLQTDASTRIARQELVSSDGVYTGLTAPIPARLGDIFPGARVALLLENQPENGLLVARVILFGNPL